MDWGCSILTPNANGLFSILINLITNLNDVNSILIILLGIIFYVIFFFNNNNKKAVIHLILIIIFISTSFAFYALINDEFNIIVNYDEHKGNQSFLITPESDTLISNLSNDVV